MKFRYNNKVRVFQSVLDNSVPKVLLWPGMNCSFCLSNGTGVRPRPIPSQLTTSPSVGLIPATHLKVSGYVILRVFLLKNLRAWARIEQQPYGCKYIPIPIEANKNLYFCSHCGKCTVRPKYYILVYIAVLLRPSFLR